MTERASLTPEYFKALYASDPDPWRFATSDYEREKYAHTLDALPAPRFASALEVGCSIGVLTRALADRCDCLLSLDVAEVALAQARTRCADAPHVRFDLAQVPRDWPVEAGPFDLILLSEVLYYLSLADIDAVAAACHASLAPGASVLLVHWTGETNYPVTGDEAAERFIAGMAGVAKVTRQERRPEYRLDVLQQR